MGGAREGRDEGGGSAVRLATVALCVTLAGGAGAAREGVPEAAHEQWRGIQQSRTLADGSVLNRYIARTEAVEEPDISLALEFVPRFGCSPLVGFRVVGPLAASLGTSLADGTRARLVIDGESTELSLLVDAGEAVTSLWVSERAEGRARLRQRLDVGSRAALTLPGERSLEFSLLGSRASAVAVEALCRDNRPPAYED